MDISSKKLPAILIVVLLGILILQFMYADSKNTQLIDPETCELYVMDKNINSRKYLDEFDEKCLEFKKLNNPDLP